MKRFMVVAILSILVLTGCTASSETPDDAVAAAPDPAETVAPDPTPTKEPAPTEEPTKVPDATPTPAPEPTTTPEPTPSPEPSPSPEQAVQTAFGEMCPERGDEQWIFATDSGNHLIHVYETTGSLVCSWGNHGDEPGEFSGPGDIAIDQDGNVFVADTENRRIQVFSADGTSVSEWGSSELHDGEWLMALSPSGALLYVVDRSSMTLTVIDATAMEIISEVESEGLAETQFVTPWHEDDVAVSLPFAVFRVDPAAEQHLLYAFPLEDTTPASTVRVEADLGLSMIKFEPWSASSIAILRDAGATVSFWTDEAGEDIDFPHIGRFDLAIDRASQLVLGDSVANTIAVYDITNLPFASIVSSWPVDSEGQLGGLALTR